MTRAFAKLLAATVIVVAMLSSVAYAIPGWNGCLTRVNGHVVCLPRR